MMAETGIEFGLFGIGLGLALFVGVGIYRLIRALKRTGEAEKNLAQIREGKTDSEQLARAMGWSIVVEVVKTIVATVAKQALIVVLERVLEALKTSGKAMLEVTEDDIRVALSETRGELWQGKVVEDLGEEGDAVAVKAVLEGIGIVREYGHFGGKRLVREAKKPGWAREILAKVRGRVFGKPERKPEHPKPQQPVKPSSKPSGKTEKVPSEKPTVKPPPPVKKPVEKVDPQFYGDGEDW